ncbi:hypothetical protein AC1031_009626 [Aphanomyces cochlioides]|nr:hypothetical protein AC1031_009626 [Aphanomyces cochlioides]
MDAYKIEREIAPALFGSILLCLDKNSGDYVAIKRMTIESGNQHVARDGTLVHEDMDVEKRVYQYINKRGGHANVLRLLDAFEQDGSQYFVLEYCAHGDLFTILRNTPHQRFGAKEALHYFTQVCRGLEYLHSVGIAHGDVSLENVLVTTSDQCKLMDFGLAAESSHVQRSTAVGKFFYMPPEMYLGVSYDAMKADMWSLGILLIIMLTGMPPFGQTNSTDNVFISFGTYGIRTILRGWKVSQYFSHEALDLVEKLLVVNPLDRPSISEVLHHPFFPRMPEARRDSVGSTRKSMPEEPAKKSRGVRKFFQKVFGKASDKRDPSEVTIDMDNQDT